MRKLNHEHQVYHGRGIIPTMKRFVIWTALPLLVLGTLIGYFVVGTQPEDITPPIAQTGSESTVNSNTPVIVAFGDSLTAGYGISLEDAYPKQLELALKEKGYDVSIVNSGVSGETTAGGVRRAEFIRDQAPALVLLGLGANDALRRIPVEETEKNLRTMLDVFRDAGIPVVLLGMKSPLNAGLGYAQSFNAMYPRLSQEYDVPLVEFFLEGVALRRELNIEDGIHPNKEGYRNIVEENLLPTILPVVKKLVP